MPARVPDIIDSISAPSSVGRTAGSRPPACDDDNDGVNRPDSGIWLVYRAFAPRWTGLRPDLRYPDTEPENQRQRPMRRRHAAGGGRPAANAYAMSRPLLGISEGDLERELLRKCVGALAAGRATLRRLRAHSAGRRAGAPLRRRRALCDLCRRRARRRARALGASSATPSAGTRSGDGAPPEPRAAGTLPRRGSRQRRDHHRPSARGGLRVPRRHRQPRRVHRPLPGRLAADARGHLRLRRRRAVPPEDADPTASTGATRR